jgi:anti-sigma B factor antagonist
MEPGVPVLTPPAELTAATSPELERMLAPHLAATGPGVVLDLSGVTFVSSAGLGQLVHTGRTLGDRGAVLCLAGARRRVARLVQTVGLDGLIPIFKSVGEASAWLASRGTPSR